MFGWEWAWNHFSFTAALIIGALIVGHKMPRRKRFVLRAALCLAAIIGFAFVWEPSFAFLSNFDLGDWGRYIFLSKYLLQYLMVIFSIWICFDCRFFAALFCGTAGYCMEHIAQRLFASLTIFTLKSTPFAFNALIRTIITAGIFVATYFLAVRKNKGSLSNIVVDGKMQIISSTIVIAVVTVLSFMVGRSQRNPELSRFATHILTMSSAFLALTLEFNVLYSKKRKDELDDLQHMLQEKHSQYQIEKANIEQINIKVHDLKHQLQGLDGKIDKKELEGISETIDIYNCFAGTGNKAIDTVITQKSLYCQKQKIRLTCVLDGNNLKFIPSHEVYALFGNAIENAIDAVESLEVEKRAISIIESRHGNFVTIRITNYFDGSLEFFEGLPVTKKNKDYHGFGMRSIKLIAQKYNGDIQAQIRGDLFILSICLPIPEKEAEQGKK